MPVYSVHNLNQIKDVCKNNDEDGGSERRISEVKDIYLSEA